MMAEEVAVAKWCGLEAEVSICLPCQLSATTVSTRHEKHTIATLEVSDEPHEVAVAIRWW
jgi:hypothetical protein